MQRKKVKNNNNPCSKFSLFCAQQKYQMRRCRGVRVVNFGASHTVDSPHDDEMMTMMWFIIIITFSCSFFCCSWRENSFIFQRQRQVFSLYLAVFMLTTTNTQNGAKCLSIHACIHTYVCVCVWNKVSFTLLKGIRRVAGHSSPGQCCPDPFRNWVTPWNAARDSFQCSLRFRTRNRSEEEHLHTHTYTHIYSI